MSNQAPNPYDFLPEVPTFTLVSDDFAEGDRLPLDQVYTALGGGNRSPHLRWSGWPEGTRSFVVTCFDPDAPTVSGFWHWSAVNLPAGTTQLASGAGAGDGTLPGEQSFHVRNDYGTRDYGGAAPPAGHKPHRYMFTVHAVDVDVLDVDRDVSPAVVGFNLFFHTLGRAYLTGVYEV
jgi:Raf kinase inhibitor-like YbhB/YbcL family protein